MTVEFARNYPLSTHTVNDHDKRSDVSVAHHNLPLQLNNVDPDAFDPQMSSVLSDMHHSEVERKLDLDEVDARNAKESSTHAIDNSSAKLLNGTFDSYFVFSFPCADTVRSIPPSDLILQHDALETNSSGTSSSDALLVVRQMERALMHFIESSLSLLGPNEEYQAKSVSALISELVTDPDRQLCFQKIGGVSRMKELIRGNCNLCFRESDSMVCITLYRDHLFPVMSECV